VRFWDPSKRGYVEQEGVGAAHPPAATGPRKPAARRSGASAALVAPDPAVRIVVAGRVERVGSYRAARMLASNAAELPSDLTRDEAVAILAAHEDRTRRQVETLERDGLLIGWANTLAKLWR
jgi:hypothetical protein